MGRSDFHGMNWARIPKEYRKQAESALDKRLPMKWRLNSQLCPQLLLVSKQVNMESTSFLYEKNFFLFLDTVAMDAFLHSCGRRIGMLHQIGIAHWDTEGAANHQYSAFRKLVEASKLEKLVLGDDCIHSMDRMGQLHWRRERYTAGQAFYRVASSWLWYMAGRTGNTAAAVSTLSFQRELEDAGCMPEWQRFVRLRAGSPSWLLTRAEAEEIEKGFKQALITHMHQASVF